MKNQYVGDIGDFGKYALLRAFAKTGVKVGVNWYLTEDDTSNDGKFTDYLKKDDFRRHAPEVFDELKKIADIRDKSVKNVEESGIIPEAVFYSDLLNPLGKPDDREQERNAWFLESTYELANSELIYLDPDNGLLEESEPRKRGAEKYALPDEVEQYYRAGHNVVYYCHKGRRKMGAWFDYKSIMCKALPDAKPIVLTYHKGTQRSYVFLVHPEYYQKYRNIIERFMGNWRDIFDEEYTNKGDLAREPVGDKFMVEKSDGSVFTIFKRADGWIQIESSASKNTSIAIKPDDFCRRLWN